MEDLRIPDGYQRVMPYLIVKDATGFEIFMKNIFGATPKMKHMREENVIMHAEMQVGGCTIMFADTTEKISSTTGGFFIYVTDADETYNKAIAAGSVALMPMADMEYGRSGGVKDPYGNVWWITSPTKPAE